MRKSIEPKKVNAEVVLTDILERLRSIEKNGSDSDKSLDNRLCKIEQEIENVKRATKAFTLIVKVVGGLIATIITVWNFVSRFKKV
jgi:hypothetical protein